MYSYDTGSSDDSCSLSSPQSQGVCSPLQRVPHLSSPPNNTGPFLWISEPPKQQFRFRYSSERTDGTHGCLPGCNSSSDLRTYPSVKLLNYYGRAFIKCQLFQIERETVHPHELLGNKAIDNNDIVVPEDGSYAVCFPRLNIIHRDKEQVLNFFINLLQSSGNLNATEINKQSKVLRKQCNLNKVRLRFSAHDINTNAEICHVYSWSINNMKSVTSNELKIHWASLTYGRPRGGQDLCLLTSKVSKKNIKVQFYEVDEYERKIPGSERYASFGERNVHHQYAILCVTPAFRDHHITSNVEVCIVLYRPTDEATSEPHKFIYKAEAVDIQAKRRKRDLSSSTSTYNDGGTFTGSVMGTSTVTSTQYFPEKPPPLQYFTNEEMAEYCAPHFTENQVTDTIGNSQSAIPQITQPVGISNPGSSSYYASQGSQYTQSPNSQEQTIFDSNQAQLIGMINSQEHLEQILPSLNTPPVIQEYIINDTDNIRLHREYADVPSTAMMSGVNPVLSEPNCRDLHMGNWPFYNNGLNESELSLSFPDSLKYTDISFEDDSEQVFQRLDGKSASRSRPSRTTTGKENENTIKVAKVLEDLFEKLSKKSKTSEVKNKLEELFNIKLGNGDTFLHKTISDEQSHADFIIKLVHKLKISHLLNLPNDQYQTILHLAIINDMPEYVSFLVSQGCNPMLEDEDGNNAIHQAVKCQSSLEALLDSATNNKVDFDLNAFNTESHTALHLAVIYSSASSASTLLERGARSDVPDAQGRTPLHLAARDARLPLVVTLLRHMTQIDAVDHHGYTALQLACDRSEGPEVCAVIEVLLRNKADPLKCEGKTRSAWNLAKNKPRIFEVVKKHMPAQYTSESNTESESEAEYESADDSDSMTSKLQDIKINNEKE